jgi:hypothetical protein
MRAAGSETEDRFQQLAQAMPQIVFVGDHRGSLHLRQPTLGAK